MKILEYIYLKSKNNSLDSRDSYYSTYSGLNIESLEYNLNIALNECEQFLKEKLNKSNYTPNSIYKDEDIDVALSKIYFWKKDCPKHIDNFKKVENLFYKIKQKDQEINEASMNTDDPCNNDIEMQTNKCHQKTMQLDKQKIIQAQELTLLNDNFGRALSSLECYANRQSGKKISNIFNYYNMFNLRNTQNMDELYKKAFVQTQIFRLAYDDYIQKYKKYTPPQNINLEEIKNLLKNWMYNVNDEAKIIYQGMLNILSSLNNSYFDEKYMSTSNKYRNAKMDPQKICSFASGVYYYNYQRCEEAENNYIKYGELISLLNINQKYTDDKNAVQLQKNIMNNNDNYTMNNDLK